ncbi:nicotinamide-nucleotide amidase [Marinomonas polaris DSM 16579]|uniref:Nicotinamide-nucleotide amidase n=1 Tax=Marinomonas polaris DSM 16579 TaxID=1122206 RepID=A0A1M5KHL6_9GAMM|nr:MULTISPECIES: nicotinamide-nucleotide amidohydrolase family protein [Marinomonas]SHG52251.1 nicotinamide-nucleotide amidase [Marinomonas polaris DSM 16579]|tara:strand:+ start:2937 stop:3437 length:501 start_codon:yes stop_codon:yes gene_type:complete
MNQMQKMTRAAQQASELLQARALLLVTAESCTGGLISAVCTEIAGSSSWFFGGVISYANEAKMRGLSVKEETLSSFGAVSEQTVKEMCAGALQLGGDISVAVSGVAGPGGGSPEKPVGCVYIGWKMLGQEAKVERFQFSGDRQAVREATVLAALHGVKEMLESSEK